MKFSIFNTVYIQNPIQTHYNQSQINMDSPSFIMSAPYGQLLFSHKLP